MLLTEKVDYDRLADCLLVQLRVHDERLTIWQQHKTVWRNRTVTRSVSCAYKTLCHEACEGTLNAVCGDLRAKRQSTESSRCAGSSSSGADRALRRSLLAALLLLGTSRLDTSRIILTVAA